MTLGLSRPFGVAAAFSSWSREVRVLFRLVIEIAGLPGTVGGRAVGRLLQGRTGEAEAGRDRRRGKFDGCLLVNLLRFYTFNCKNCEIVYRTS